jgi:hypothetical protein
VFCERCGSTVATGEVACKNCGAPVTVSAEPAAPSGILSDDSVPDVRPWVRYWARMTDNVLFAILLGLSALWPPIAAAADKIPDRALGLLLLFSWVFVEAALLATIGTTPSKWLLRTTIKSGSGQPLSYSRSLFRSFNVWLRGLGIGFPLATLITNIVAYNRLTRTGTTSWDEDGGFVIRHGTIGVVRVLAAMFINVGFVALAILATIADK